MFNPLVDSFDHLSDTEVENKALDLQRKYFMTYNPQVQEQISAILDMYQEETKSRRAKAYLQQNQQNGESGLDKLINVS
jgi:hypothetical protein|tara:strand:+ start:3932 stop:4168 length:237 start_codon:yes stop_codon:yes gene_type:complete